MLSHDKSILFLRRNPALSISILEKEAGLPNSTLAKALGGDRILNAKHLNALYPILVKYGYNESQYKKARVISIVNHKGGVGKTTTTINLGKALVKLGFKILLIDMDSQGNLSQSLGIDNPEKQVVDALLKNEELPVVIINENYHLSPSDLDLAYADLELVQAVGGVNQLKNRLNPLRELYDYILIDCPPALNIFTNSALVASNGCLVTLQPEVSAMKGVNNLFERISQIRERINPELVVEGIVLTMVDKRLKVHRDMIEYINQSLNNFRIYDTQIRINVALKESQISQINIFDYDNNSNGATDYMSLAKEFCSNI